MLLNYNDLERYKTLSAHNIRTGRRAGSAKAYQRLVDLESLLLETCGVTLPYYLALTHHLAEYSIRTVADFTEFSSPYIQSVFDYLSIPRLNDAETKLRVWKQEKGIHGVNPETGKKNRVAGGRVGGIKTLKLGVGIHGTDPKTGELYRTVGSMKGVESRAEKYKLLHSPS